MIATPHGVLDGLTDHLSVESLVDWVAVEQADERPATRARTQIREVKRVLIKSEGIAIILWDPRHTPSKGCTRTWRERVQEEVVVVNAIPYMGWGGAVWVDDGVGGWGVSGGSGFGVLGKSWCARSRERGGCASGGMMWCGEGWV